MCPAMAWPCSNGAKAFLRADHSARRPTRLLDSSLEIDANYKQFKTASRLRAAAALRLESQRAYYDEGRITIDRFLDAVSQYANAVATEAQHKTTYNISIVALEEAKGTLLEYKQITVVDGPKTGVKAIVGRVAAAKPVSNQLPAVVTAPVRTDQFVEPAGGHANGASPTATGGAKTVSFQFTIGVGSRPVEIRGSFTITPAPPVRGSNAP